MRAKYLIERESRSLIFTGKPKSIEQSNIKKKERCSFVSAVIPNSVKTIGDETFYICSGLASIHIPNSVSSIGWNAFYNCASLTTIHIPNSVSSIGWNAFNDCSALAAIHIPNSVYTVGGFALYHNSRLHKICLPPNARLYANNCDYYSLSFLRPRLKPIHALQKKTCRATKVTYSIFL